MKTIWYGVDNGNTARFSEDQNVLKSQHNINNPQSFTVSGEVNGLEFVQPNEQKISGGQQTA